MVGSRSDWVAAAQAALLLSLQSLINGKYFEDASRYHKPPCPTCRSPRNCNNYFCVMCMTEGLCPIVFRGDNEHCNHPWLQVRYYSREYSVLLKGLEHFISKEGLKHIHTNSLNDGERHCKLRSKPVAEASSSSRRRPGGAAGEKSCQGCTANIRGSRNSRETFLVCSLDCLINVARERSEWDLVAMNDDAMEPMEPPLFLKEKISIAPRMLETPTETPTERSVESILEALPFPFAIDDYPMFGTPAEATFGEALPFPPATEEFSMFEERAAPAETPQLETTSLPTEIQDLDSSPLEWLKLDD